MGSAAAEVAIDSSLAEVWEALVDTSTWTSWLDGFERVVSQDSGWPEVESELQWTSVPSGRGTVTERVAEMEPRRLLAVEYTDRTAAGRLETRLSMEAGKVQLSQELRYKLLDPGPFGVLGELLFVRGEQRRSMQRSQVGLKTELERAARASER